MDGITEKKIEDTKNETRETIVCRACLIKMTIKDQEYVCDICGHKEPLDSIGME